MLWSVASRDRHVGLGRLEVMQPCNVTGVGLCVCCVSLQNDPPAILVPCPLLITQKPDLWYACESLGV
jgi:hypothetical protein